MNFEYLPIDIIYKIVDTDINDNKTILNLSSTSKNLKSILKNNIETRKKLVLYYNECIQRGERYKKINCIYDKYYQLNSCEIFTLTVNSIEAKEEICKWYSLLEIGDIIFEDRFWMDDDGEHIYKNVEIIKKGKSYKYLLTIGIDMHELLFNLNPKQKNYIGFKTPGKIIIPPRTDIIII
jgi:hypothetical protein